MIILNNLKISGKLTIASIMILWVSQEQHWLLPQYHKYACRRRDWDHREARAEKQAWLWH